MTSKVGLLYALKVGGVGSEGFLAGGFRYLDLRAEQAEREVHPRGMLTAGVG